ncbi:MAG: hypothetical protein HQM03_13505 [Magnetococcales bacterium]|nr:hypothetical protein [Magnetococcales bacterium]
MRTVNCRPLTDEERKKIETPYIKNHSEPEEYRNAKKVLKKFMTRNRGDLRRLGDLLNQVHQ